MKRRPFPTMCSTFLCAIFFLSSAGVEECPPTDPPPPTCDLIGLEVDVHGWVVVSNANESSISFSLEIASYRCSSSGCTWYGDYPTESLESGQSAEYTADIPPEMCMMVYCCDEGFVGTTSATLVLEDVGCTITEEAEQSVCGF